MSALRWCRSTNCRVADPEGGRPMTAQALGGSGHARSAATGLAGREASIRLGQSLCRLPLHPSPQRVQSLDLALGLTPQGRSSVFSPDCSPTPGGTSAGVVGDGQHGTLRRVRAGRVLPGGPPEPAAAVAGRPGGSPSMPFVRAASGSRPHPPRFSGQLAGTVRPRATRGVPDLRSPQHRSPHEPVPHCRPLT